jgi:putative transposase
VALEQRITAYQRRHVSVSRFEQEAELKDIRAAFPEYAAIHSHILQDVLARLDRTYQAFFHRVQRGQRAGFPRYVRHSKLSVAMSGGWRPHPLRGVCPPVPT